MFRRITLGTAFCAALSYPADAAPILYQSSVSEVEVIARSQPPAETLNVDFDEFLFSASVLFRSPSDNGSRGVPLLSDALISELAGNGVSPLSLSNSAAATVHHIKFAVGASVGDVLKFVKRPPIVPVIGGGASDDDGPAAVPDDDASSHVSGDAASSPAPPDGAAGEGQGSGSSPGEWANPGDALPGGLESEPEADGFPISTGGLTEGAVGYAPVGLSPVPEPASMVLLLTGAAVGTLRHRMKRRAG